MNNSTSPFTKITFTGVLGLVLILNATMTAIFGATYLPAAFGRDGIFSTVAGAVYALLILDLAALAYIRTYATTAETKYQRTITLSVGILCLLGSIFATVVQLSNTAFGLATLAEYQQTIEVIALIMLIVLTAIHASVAIFYPLLSRAESAKQRAINIKTDVTESALSELEALMRQDAAALAGHMSRDMRRDVLHELGFNDQLQPATIAAGRKSPDPLSVNGRHK